MFNWQQEAARFTPRLRVHVHGGAQRRRSAEDFLQHDLILTTYGTLRRDITHLRDVELDYVILDESQAIKNAGTESAKAARLLRARHRLAMSGTPIENRLAELWSLFEFLNPGMLGSAPVFQRVTKSVAGSSVSPADDDVRALLARAVRRPVTRG